MSNLTKEKLKIKNISLSIEQHNEIIKRYESAKGTVSREILLEVAKDLNIVHKKNTIVEQDLNMIKKAGHNQNPKIINVSNSIKKNSMKKLTTNAINLSTNMYVNNKNRYTLIHNIDTEMDFEIRKLGIKKTFSKNVPIDKIPTANKLHDIGEQGIYLITSYDKNDKTGIKYHHFLTPVKLINTGRNVFVRIVIKEYTKDVNMNNKFYYHQLQYLDIKKELPT